VQLCLPTRGREQWSASIFRVRNVAPDRRCGRRGLYAGGSDFFRPLGRQGSWHRRIARGDDKKLQRTWLAISSNSRFLIVPTSDHLPLLGNKEHAAAVSDAIIRLVQSLRRRVFLHQNEPERCDSWSGNFPQEGQGLIVPSSILPHHYTRRATRDLSCGRCKSTLCDGRWWRSACVRSPR
jgi:hypothetical protein